MQKRSEDDYLPQVMSLNPSELINWCRNRKQFLGLSNQRLAEQSGVPVGRRKKKLPPFPFREAGAC